MRACVRMSCMYLRSVMIPVLGEAMTMVCM